MGARHSLGHPLGVHKIHSARRAMADRAYDGKPNVATSTHTTYFWSRVWPAECISSPTRGEQLIKGCSDSSVSGSRATYTYFAWMSAWSRNTWSLGPYLEVSWAELPTAVGPVDYWPRRQLPMALNSQESVIAAYNCAKWPFWRVKEFACRAKLVYF